ncbi:hypothetical protein QQ045_022294 [Rhodiola kirilowii]
MLEYLVDQSQAAFVKGRNIAYNISLVQELLCKYNQKHLSKRCMLKIDITKAYDMVDWNFLKSILELFGFPQQHRASQGDSISPYLFTLVMEVLSRVLGQMRQSNEFGLIWDPCRRSKKPLLCSNFHGWSGLDVNVNKSAMYFGGCDEAEQQFFAQAVGFQVGKLPFSYLGVLLDGRSLRRQAYEGLIDKMTSKIRAWATRHFSYAGRLVLIKHVLSTISSYWMRVLLFPKTVLRKISAICRNFLWSGSISRKRNLVAWKRVTKTKEEGGLKWSTAKPIRVQKSYT